MVACGVRDGIPQPRMKICTARPSLPVPPIGITSPTDTSDPRDVLLVFIRTALTNKLQVIVSSVLRLAAN